MDFLSLDFIYRPLYQLCFFVLLTVLFIPFFRKRNANAVWNVAGIFYIGFILTNSLCLLLTQLNVWMYFLISLGYSVAYILVAGLVVPFLMKTLKINGSGESAMIFLFFIYHPVLLLLVILGKWMLGG